MHAPAPTTTRRQHLAVLLGIAASSMPFSAQALRAGQLGNQLSHQAIADAPTQLNQEQSRLARAWICKIIHTQLSQQPSPRWQQRDCAGLVRFAVAESLREHDLAWRRANGLLQTALPPDIQLTPQQAQLRHRWKLQDGSHAAYVGALELIQENSVFIGKNWQSAAMGDLFLYDQGDEQHLMVWMGRYVAYHTGKSNKQDNGLRAVPIQKLMQWQDSRWQAISSNPNFAGVYRLAFLSPI